MKDPLALLIGTWRGTVEVTFPTIESSTCEEEMRFKDGGAGPDFAFVSYTERAWDAETGLVQHSERGFWRCEGRVVDVTLAHPIGVTEVSEGTVQGPSITLASTSISRAASGLEVLALHRRYEVQGDQMRYEIHMATPETPLTLHLTGTLARAS